MITLQLTNLKKSFGSNTVFEHLNLVHSQGPLGIAGPNGSGKSTLLQCLGGLLSPSAGTITWKENEHALPREELQSRLGYAAPYINLYDELSCRENLVFLSDVRSDNHSGEIDQWLQKVGLTSRSNHPFGKLSTGQRQRLRLAAALFHQPDILLLDEPGSNLDSDGEAVVASIAHYFNQPDKLLVIASNNPKELDLCEKVFSIQDGEFARSA